MQKINIDLFKDQKQLYKQLKRRNKQVCDYFRPSPCMNGRTFDISCLGLYHVI